MNDHIDDAAYSIHALNWGDYSLWKRLCLRMCGYSPYTIAPPLTADEKANMKRCTEQDIAIMSYQDIEARRKKAVAYWKNVKIQAPMGYDE
jgi:hypothetical protein